MKKIAGMSQIEIAAFVQTYLQENGVNVVLSGGAATGYYSNNKYVSGDLDLVNKFSVPRKRIEKLMNEIGFFEKAKYFKHPESEFVIEFPPGPLSVGMEAVNKIEFIPLETGTLQIISATDCVKDRLAAFYFWGDKQCLQQAVWVSQAMPVDQKEIERWSTKEERVIEYRQYLKSLNQ